MPISWTQQPPAFSSPSSSSAKYNLCRADDDDDDENIVDALQEKKPGGGHVLRTHLFGDDGNNEPVWSKQQQQQKSKAKTKTVSKHLAYAVIASLISLTLLLLLALLLLGICVVLLRRQHSVPPGARTAPAPVPDFPFHTRVFHREGAWEYGPEAEGLWEALVPNSGLVYIEDPAHYGLGPGLATKQKNAAVYGISVTHQYHCLKLIRAAFHGLATGSPAAHAEFSVPAGNLSDPLPAKTSHVFHCIDYIRQIILCKADLTVEWRAEGSEEHINGYGPPHQCRDWDRVYEWMVGRLPPDERYWKHQ